MGQRIPKYFFQKILISVFAHCDLFSHAKRWSSREMNSSRNFKMFCWAQVQACQKNCCLRNIENFINPVLPEICFYNCLYTIPFSFQRISWFYSKIILEIKMFQIGFCKNKLDFRTQWFILWMTDLHQDPFSMSCLDRDNEVNNWAYPNHEIGYISSAFML